MQKYRQRFLWLLDLSKVKHDLFFLIFSYLCFERNQLHTKKNIAINLMDILSVKKVDSNSIGANYFN